MSDREELLNDLDEMLILQSPSLELMSKASEMIKELEVENHALGLIIDNEDKELADKVAELTAKLDKAREALSMASWNNIGGYEGQQRWLELNRELDK
jgi:hypothetical protein